MSRLEELINELCPDGVEYKPLEECCIILDKQRKPVTKAARQKGEYRYYGANGIQDYVSDYIFDGTFVLVGEDGSVMTSNGKPIVNWAKGKIWVNNHAHIIAEKEDTSLRYLYHLLQTIDVRNLIHGNIPKLTQGDFKSLQIPLPPLSIQSEIVHILDSFTLLTAELTAELTARQKQYAFYRDYLLDFSDEDVTKKIPDIDCSNVEYIKLKDVCKIGDGLHSTPIYDNNGSYYFINGNNLENGRITFTENTKRINISQYERYKIELDDATILMSINGTIGKIALYNREPIILGKSVAYFNVNERILKKYLYYLLQTNRSNAYYEKNLTGSTIKNLGLKALREYQIPLPPIDVQKNIIKILDRFDKLNNDMSEGLPAEIEARKKQYEYYRDTLLSFDDKACSQIVKVERERELTRSKAIKWISIQELFNLRNGYTPSKSKSEYWTNGTIPWFRMEDIRENGHILNDSIQHITPIAVKGKLFPANSIILATSATIGEHALITVDSLANQRFTYLTVKNEYSNQLNMKYIYYYFFKIDEWCKNNLNVSSFASVDMDKFKKLKFPIPPLEEQERIVSILDRFDKLCNDISEGLPAEIEARQKQYEYYRDKLLNFKEKTNE